MHLQDLRDALRRPFRLYLSDGETFDILHPALCVPGLHSALIGLQAAGETEPVLPQE